MRLFVFPLHQTVFLPGTSKPVRVVESRYIRMVQDALKDDIPIALGYSDADIPVSPEGGRENSLDFPLPVRQIVGFGRAQIMEKNPDGTLLIFVQNQGKAKLLAPLLANTPYLVYSADVIREDERLQEAELSSFMAINKLLGSWIAKNVDEPQVQAEFLNNINTPKEVIGCFTAFLLKDPDLQQMVLEANSYKEKIQILWSLIQSGQVFD